MKTIYIVCGRDYHSLEVAFTTEELAKSWVKGRRTQYDIVRVQLEDDHGRFQDEECDE